MKKNEISSFWQYLGFGGCFSYSDLNSKVIEKLIFLAFGTILVLVVPFPN